MQTMHDGAWRYPRGSFVLFGGELGETNGGRSTLMARAFERDTSPGLDLVKLCGVGGYSGVERGCGREG